jgi:hypothetical protein
MFAAQKNSSHSAVQTNEPIMHLFQLQILAEQIHEFNIPFLVKMSFIFKYFSW